MAVHPRDEHHSAGSRFHHPACAVTPGAASAPLSRTYRPREPQQSVLFRIVRENLETLLAEGRERSASGEGYPTDVEKEFRGYLLCGDMSRGFARCRCAACGHELLLPFSCKNRGLCPSCTARRMSDEAAYLVDMVLPEAPYRQWTLTFPFPIRYLMARDYTLITAVLGVAMRVLFAWQRRQARRAGHAGAKTAGVTFVQRFGGAMNANLHMHVLLPDGVFVLGDDEAFTFVPLPPPEDEDIRRLVLRLGRRVRAFVEKRYGTLDDVHADVLEGAIGEAMQSVPLVSIDDTSDDEVPDGDGPRVRRSRRCASVDGFSIHANTAVAPNNRIGLEKLCRYGMRPPFSHDRLSITCDGKVLLGLRRPWPTEGGVSALCFEPVQFLRRLTPLIPPPFAHLIRYHGLFAPNAKGRDLVPAAPVSWTGISPEAYVRAKNAAVQETTSEGTTAAPLATRPPSSPRPEQPSANRPPLVHRREDTGGRHEGSGDGHDAGTPPMPCLKPGRGERPRRRSLPWADLLRRVFAVDVLVCAKCGGPMTVLAYITELSVVGKILTHLGLPTTPLPVLPPRLPEQTDLFDDERMCGRSGRHQGGRGPPPDQDTGTLSETDGPEDDGDWAA